MTTKYNIYSMNQDIGCGQIHRTLSESGHANEVLERHLKWDRGSRHLNLITQTF